MKQFKMCFFILTFGVFSCSDNKKPERDKSAPSSIEIDSFRGVQNITKKAEIIKLDETIEIDSLNTEKNTNQKSAYFAACKTWSLSKSQIRELILNLEPINGSTWHHCYDDTECSIKARIRKDNTFLDVEISAGSWLVIDYPDTTIYYGDEKGKYKRMFIAYKRIPK